jgi:hypothetical protein
MLSCHIQAYWTDGLHVQHIHAEELFSCGIARLTTTGYGGLDIFTFLAVAHPENVKQLEHFFQGDITPIFLFGYTACIQMHWGSVPVPDSSEAEWLCCREELARAVLMFLLHISG